MVDIERQPDVVCNGHTSIPTIANNGSISSASSNDSAHNHNSRDSNAKQAVAILSSTSENNTRTKVEHSILTVVRVSRVREKITFVISVISMLIIAISMFHLQWFIPYYYAISAPLLIGLRIFLYVKYKWQYFLIDFCYFGNTILYIFIWAAPHQPELFTVTFALMTGPVAGATILFRNSLVFHMVDKMTSVYIHVLPMYLVYVIRWYPDIVSKHWYTSFLMSFNTEPGYMFIWLVGVAFGCFAAHTIIYMLIVYAICRPDQSYLNSYRYLSTRDNWVAAILNFFGRQHSFLMFSLFNWLYCIGSLLLTVLLYRFFIAHSIYICVISLNILFNGAAYYMDVFSVKGFSSDSS